MDRRRLHTVTRRVFGKVAGGGAFLAIVERMTGGPDPVEAAIICDLRALMNGQKETDGNGTFGLGDPDGTGNACIDLRTSQICWKIKTSDIAPATMAHIHRGTRTQKGSIVVDFGAELRGCTPVAKALINEIRTTPAGFYVNVHNGDFPNGAIRGQLKQV